MQSSIYLGIIYLDEVQNIRMIEDLGGSLATQYFLVPFRSTEEVKVLKIESPNVGNGRKYLLGNVKVSINNHECFLVLAPAKELNLTAESADFKEISANFILGLHC